MVQRRYTTQCKLFTLNLCWLLESRRCFSVTYQRETLISVKHLVLLNYLLARWI